MGIVLFWNLKIIEKIYLLCCCCCCCWRLVYQSGLEQSKTWEKNGIGSDKSRKTGRAKNLCWLEMMYLQFLSIVVILRDVLTRL